MRKLSDKRIYKEQNMKVLRDVLICYILILVAIYGTIITASALLPMWMMMFGD